MPETEKLSGTYDMYDEFDCESEEGAKTVEVKEEEDSETDFAAVESVEQSAGNGKWMIHVAHFTLLMLFFVKTVVKTEEQTESAIDMFDDEFYAIMEQDFSDNKNANETNKAESVNEDLETDSDDTEIDEDHSAVSGEWAVFVWFFIFTLFILQNRSQTPSKWSIVSRAVHRVNSSWMVLKDGIKATSVSNATKALIVHLISNDTNWCTLAYESTSVQFAPNHLGWRVLLSYTSLFTLA